MASAHYASLVEALESRLPARLKSHAGTVVLVAGGGVGLLALRAVTRHFYKSNPFKFGRTGALKKDEIDSSFTEYETFFDQKEGAGIKDGQLAGKAKANTPEFVDKFYSLITDFYEYGWGQSFHFAPRNKGESFDDSIKRYEVTIAQAAGVAPGGRALDLGCGVGGPMRTIARATGAHVTGITINEYQVRRCREHNVRQGLAAQCAVVQGNFLELPFPEGSFDAAYCVEAACHAPSLEALYRQVFAVLKPGARFASYEWLRTPKYDPGNAEHVAIVDKVAVGNALPDVRDLEAVLAAAAAAGFEVVSTQDAALTGAVPWHRAMTSARMGAYLTHLITSVMEAVRWAPKGTAAVHGFLLAAAIDLEKAGQLGVFTPMYLVVFKKPEA